MSTDVDRLTIGNAQYAAHRLQALAGRASPSEPWQADARELSGALRYFVGYFDGIARKASDRPPASARQAAAQLLAWHDSRGQRQAALVDVFALLARCDDGQQSGGDLVDALSQWAERHAAFCPPGAERPAFLSAD